ncbi:DUF2628 domain-containing protein [Maridesulfovibrio sp.]|uniref:DUF2628 domain-containing protein n=1 Tax=Maridesulfovibrio sp. TaxID=2795000 RepID=UPI002AA70370|nr:DUF2628 domain-containing protein [Maridesulfovibrio sp.]
MKFKNPSNGYVEEVSDNVGWIVLLFGPFYFAVKGVWTHCAASLIIAFCTGGISWLIYPFFAKSIMENHYLKNGWKWTNERGHSGYVREETEIVNVVATCSECGNEKNESSECFESSWCPFCKTKSANINFKCSECGYDLEKGAKYCKGCKKVLSAFSDEYVDMNEKNKVLSDSRECPYCFEVIKAKAIKCKHCGSEVEPI